MRLPVNAVIHTTLVGLKPTTFRLLVRRSTSSATDLVLVADGQNIGWQLKKETDKCDLVRPLQRLPAIV